MEAQGLPLGQLNQPFFATADGMKAGGDGASDLTGSMTKYTKNQEAVSDLGSSLQGPNMHAFRDGSNRRGGRGRQQAMVDYMQYSTDFAGRRQLGDDMGTHTGFEHTQNITPGSFDGPVFRFGGSVRDTRENTGGFESMSHKAVRVAGGPTPRNMKRSGMKRTQTIRGSGGRILKTKSASSKAELAKMDHTCFI